MEDALHVEQHGRRIGRAWAPRDRSASRAGCVVGVAVADACMQNARRTASSRAPAWFCCANLAASPTSPAPTNATRVYDELREALLDGGIPPGERLRTAALAERFGTSRTPVREALVLLEGDGLVELEPRRGAIARGFAADDIAEIYDVRALLEPRAAVLASRRIEPDAVAPAAGALRPLRGRDRPPARGHRQPDRVERGAAPPDPRGRRQPAPARRAARRRLDPARLPHRLLAGRRQRALSQACHRELVAALAAGDAERAEATMRMHVVAGRAYLSEVTMHRTRGAAA